MPSDSVPTLVPTGQITTPDAMHDAIVYLQNLAREGAEAVSPWKAVVDENVNLFQYGDPDGEPDSTKLTINHVKPAVIAITDIQTKEPPSCTLEPVETGEPPLYYYGGPAEAATPLIMAGFLMPEEVEGYIDPDTGEPRPPANIDPLRAGYLKALAIPEEVNPALPPGGIRPEWLVEVCDKTVAEFYQTLFDVFYDRSEANQFIRECTQQTNIQGWTFSLYQFDETTLTHCMDLLRITQCYADPTESDVRKMAYFGFDLPMDASRAKALYPALSEIIDQEATVGTPNRPDSQTEWSSLYDRSFQRPMVTFRVFWLRNQIVPMTKEEAVALGLVEEVLPYGDEQPSIDGTGAGDVPAPTTVADDAQLPPADGGDASEELADGRPSLGAASASVQPACILVATGQPVAPGDPAWPTRIGIRQLTQVGQSTIVDDRETEFRDIPILHNVNVPIATGGPFGHGEPAMLKSVQKNINILANAAVEHAKYFAAPMTWVPESTYAKLSPQDQADGFIRPGRLLVVEDIIVQNTNGNPIGVQDPPPLPPALPEMYALLKAEIQELSGYTDAIRGIGNPQDSGRKTELLQSAGSSQISFKASRTRDMVKRLCLLMLDSLVRRLSVEDVEKIISRYPRHILEIIMERAKAIEWNVKVVIHANAGEDMAKKQMALLLYQAQLISKQSAQEDARRDPELEDKRQMAEAAKLARMGVGPEQEGEQGGEKKQEKPAA